jgi:hypothetical protein
VIEMVLSAEHCAEPSDCSPAIEYSGHFSTTAVFNVRAEKILHKVLG